MSRILFIVCIIAQSSCAEVTPHEKTDGHPKQEPQKAAAPANERKTRLLNKENVDKLVGRLSKEVPPLPTDKVLLLGQKERIKADADLLGQSSPQELDEAWRTASETARKMDGAMRAKTNDRDEPYKRKIDKQHIILFDSLAEQGKDAIPLLVRFLRDCRELDNKTLAAREIYALDATEIAKLPPMLNAYVSRIFVEKPYVKGESAKQEKAREEFEDVVYSLVLKAKESLHDDTSAEQKTEVSRRVRQYVLLELNIKEKDQNELISIAIEVPEKDAPERLRKLMTKLFPGREIRNK